MDFSFPINPTLSAVAIAFQNTDDSLIADLVLPRIPTGQTFNWTKYGIDQAFTVPDTRVGNKSEPNKVDFGGTSQTGAVRPYGLMDSIGSFEMKAFQTMPKPSGSNVLSPEDLSAMMLTNLILLDREIRVANKTFNAANYPAAQQIALSGSSQWTDPTSDPVSQILGWMDSCLIRPNTLVLSRTGWSALRKHPKIVQAVIKNAAGAGIVSRQAVADLFELKQILVGDAQLNTAKKGQPVAWQRAWGKHAALIYVSQLAAQANQPVFGFTAQMGQRIAGSIPNTRLGIEGGVDVKVGEYVEEVLCCPETSFFVQNVVP